MEEEKKHMDELIVTYLTEGLDKSALAELKAWIAASKIGRASCRERV